MDRRNVMAEKMRAEAGESPLVRRLREAGLWPLPPNMTPEQVGTELKARTQQKQAAQEEDCLA